MFQSRPLLPDTLVVGGGLHAVAAPRHAAPAAGPVPGGVIKEEDALGVAALADAAEVGPREEFSRGTGQRLEKLPRLSGRREKRQSEPRLLGYESVAARSEREHPVHRFHRRGSERL